MTTNSIDRLSAFKKRNKFSVQAWEERGLNPSNDELCKNLTLFFDNCVDDIIETIENQGSKKDLKRTLTKQISLLNKGEYDTEEKEFLCDLFVELSKIIDVDIMENLNKWLYGSFLSALFKIGDALKSQSVIETHSQPCTECGINLETPIIKKDKAIPESSWLVVSCDCCNELNLLALGPKIKETKNGNYKWVRTLFKDDYPTYEKALVRLEQLKAFKK